MTEDVREVCQILIRCAKMLIKLLEHFMEKK